MKAYHSAKDMLRSLKEQEKNLRMNTPETSQDQINKITTKIKKCELEVENSDNKYHNAVRDITNYNPKYQDDMSYEFNLCQEFEKVRREIVKEKLAQLVSCLDRRIFIEK